MPLINILRSLAKALRGGESAEVTVADLGLENDYFWNDDLKRWCRRGEEHKAETNQIPPPPTAKMGTGPLSTQPCASQSSAKRGTVSAADALIIPPPYLLGKRSAVLKPTVPSLPVPDVACLLTSTVDEIKPETNNQLHSDKVLSSGGPGSSSSNLAANALHPDVPRTPCVADLCGELRETRCKVTAWRRAGVARRARQSAWYACSQQTARDAKHASKPCWQSIVETELQQLEEHEELGENLLLLSLRLLWRATFEANAMNVFVELGGLRRITSVMMSSPGRHVGVQTAACGILRNVAEDKFHRAAIIRANGHVLAVSAMQQHSDNVDLLRIACQALYGLALCSRYRGLIARAGGGVEAQKLAFRSMPRGQASCRGALVDWGLRLHEIMDYGLA